MKNPKIEALEKKLSDMKKMPVEGFIDEKQASTYFAERETMLEDIVKTLADIETATTSETESVQEAIKGFRDMLKNQNSSAKQLSRTDVQYNVGKALVAAWTGDNKTLGELHCVPNLKNDNWNSHKDFSWNAEKGMFTAKASSSTPVGAMGNMSTNDQYLINPVYEDMILQDALKQSVMMPLVTHRPMTSSSLFVSEHDRGGVVLNWLTSYGEKIKGTKPTGPTRKELKAYTLAGYIPFFDEFEEDVFADLGRLFMEEFTECYAKEFDKQCLIANASPFTGALQNTGVKKYSLAGALTSLSYIDFRNAELQVSAEERKDCKWFFHESVLNHVANITDKNGNPIWRRPGDGKPGFVDGYAYYECSQLPQITDTTAGSPFAIFMNPKRIYHGNRKGIEIKRFDGTKESLETGENFLRFRKRDGFLVTRASNMVTMSSKAE